MNLNCATRGKRRITESDTSEPIEIIAPKSVEIVAGEDDLPLKPFAVKIEPGESQKVIEPQATAPVAEEDDDRCMDGLDLSNLVVLEAVNEKGEKFFKVHLIDSETDEMSEEPLDLPQEVIDYIVEAHQKQQDSSSGVDKEK